MEVWAVLKLKNRAINYITGMLLLIITCLSSAGCDISSKDYILVETREYTGDADGLHYTGWSGATYKADSGTCILNNTKYKISAAVESTSGDNANILFSKPVVLPDRNTEKRDYRLAKNKTYVLVSGSGISGLEIKIRYY